MSAFDHAVMCRCERGQASEIASAGGFRARSGRAVSATRTIIATVQDAGRPSPNNLSTCSNGSARLGLISMLSMSTGSSLCRREFFTSAGDVRLRAWGSMKVGSARGSHGVGFFGPPSHPQDRRLRGEAVERRFRTTGRQASATSRRLPHLRRQPGPAVPPHHLAVSRSGRQAQSACPPEAGYPFIGFRLPPLRGRNDACARVVDCAAAYIENHRRIGGADTRPELLGRNEIARGRHRSPPDTKETALGPREPDGATVAGPARRRLEHIHHAFKAALHKSPLTIRRSRASVSLDMDMPFQGNRPTKSI